jgi:O-antigen biosynthesis protein
VRRAQLVAAHTTDYPTALEADRNARAIIYSGEPSPITFSLLTGIYARTPVRYFERMADSLRSQTWPFHQWIIVTDGPIPNALEALVTNLARDQRVALVRQLDSVGIIGGLRRACERATGEFIVPMDHDDLLEPDALQVLAAAIAETQADLVYTDEDTVTEDTFGTPFRRPDFDPVLNLETSYIWHACAFKRELAVRLDVYSDQGSEYCHDWDTLMRFSRAGASIAHVPHVLYHWRTHGLSQSYSGAQNDGSVASTRHLLERVARKLPNPERYEVRPFPMYRGAEEWYIARLEEAPPKLSVVYFTDDARSRHDEEPALATDFPFHRKLVISCANGWAMALDEIAHRIDAGTEYVAMVKGFGYAPIGRGWPWEAIRLLELHPDAAVVSGRVLDDRGTVLDAGRRAGRWAMALNDFVALNRTDPGPFALALKPHSIDQPCEALLIVDVNFVQSLIEVARAEMPSTLSQLITAAARLHRRRIVYSPLIESGIRHAADLSTQRIRGAEAGTLSAAVP